MKLCPPEAEWAKKRSNKTAPQIGTQSRTEVGEVGLVIVFANFSLATDVFQSARAPQNKNDLRSVSICSVRPASLTWLRL